MTLVSSARRGPSAPSATSSSYLPAWLERIPPHIRVLIVVLVVAILLTLWPIAGGASDYDEGVYWQSLRAMAAGHPLFTSVFSSQPPFFLVGLYPFYLLFGQTLEAARLAIAVYALIGVLGMYALGRMVGGRWTGVAAAALLAFTPLYLAESHTLQAEAPSVALEVICVALAVLARKNTGRMQFALAAGSGVALSLGILIKLFAIVALVPAVLYLIPWGESTRPRDALLAIRRALPTLGFFALGAVLAFVAVLAPFVGHLDLVYDQVVRFHTVASQTNNSGLGNNISMVLTAGQYYPLWILVIIALVLAARRRSWVVLPPLAWLLVTLAFLLYQQPLMGHHLTLLAPPLALLAALSVPLALQTFAGGPVHFARVTPPALAPAIPLLLLSIMALISISQDVKMDRGDAHGPSALQTQMASALQRFSLPDDLVASDDQYIAGLADRSVLPQLVDTSYIRTSTKYLTAPQIEALLTQSDTRVILFASGRFNSIHGFSKWVKENYTLVTTFPNGGALYLKGAPALPIT